MKKRIIITSILVSVLLVFISCGYNNRQHENKRKVKNIILLIGDGMGVSHVYAGITASNTNSLELERCTDIGFSKTYSSSHYITDSGAGATAIAIGRKTYNSGIGIDADTLSHKTILEIAEENKLSTGLVATCRVTHATPASFIAHQKNRNSYEDIALDFLKTDIDVVIGGGWDNFNNRKDSIDLLKKFSEKNYYVLDNMDEIQNVDSGKLIGLVSEGHPPSMLKGRGDMLPQAAKTAINILNKNPEGFFLMIEGSQIDWEAHGHNTSGIIKEVLDFDTAVGIALDFAEQDGNTLVIVTGDHETGGFSLNGGDFAKDSVFGKFTTGAHTGVMVPVFAFGPGSENFSGIFENTAIFDKMMYMYGFKKE
ncbi:alkaline phosphatase [Bacteroidota bacterium]